MSAGRRRAQAFDIWPGFVDALATLLIIIIFLLMVFAVAQFFLTQALSGRDEALERANRQLAQLAEILALERESNADMKLTVAQLSAQLQGSLAQRDELSDRVTQLGRQRDALESRLAGLMGERESLAARLSDTERLLEQVRRDAQETTSELGDAAQAMRSDREQIEVQIRLIEQLRALREGLEARIVELTAGLRAAERQNEETGRVLSETRSERDRRINELLASLAAAERKAEDTARQLDETSRSLTEANRALAETSRGRAEARERARSLESDLQNERAVSAAAQAQVALLNSQLAALRQQLARIEQALEVSEARAKEQDVQIVELGRRLNAALAEKVQELAQRNRELEAARAREAALAAEVAARNQALEQALARETAQAAEIAARNRALEEAMARETAQRSQIASLDAQLAEALKSQVAELSRYRSEFFGRLREVLRDRSDVQIVGDRFVFQSEVFFESGLAQIGDPGRQQLDRVATLLREIAPSIPANIDWILQVEGHTDDRPINTFQFPSNWELSTARAISVLRYLTQRGIPESRLAAAGYGEYRPIDARPSEEARRRNRRIELKLTQR